MHEGTVRGTAELGWERRPLGRGILQLRHFRAGSKDQSSRRGGQQRQRPCRGKKLAMLKHTCPTRKCPCTHLHRAHACSGTDEQDRQERRGSRWLSHRPPMDTPTSRHAHR